MACNGILIRSRQLFCFFLLTLSAFSAALDFQHKKITVFDDVQGVQGELIVDSSQTHYQWKSGPVNAVTTDASGFAYRQFNEDFIFSVELKSQLQSGRRINFGVEVRSVSGPSFTIKTKGDAQGNVVVDLNHEPHTQSAALVAVKNPDVFKVERHGGELIFSVAKTGKPWQVIFHHQVLPSQVMNVGIYRQFIFNDNSILEIRNLRWVIPSWKGLIPYYDYLGSRLELLDIDTGAREVIYETRAGIEAPNWLDVDNIIYNSSGRIYKLHLPTRKVAFIDTGFGIKNSNDHIISFAGKWLGVSHHSKEYGGESIIYKLPIEGGEPQQLTFKAPSYLHSWSPDGRYIIYTGKRNGRFSIYRTTTDGVGEETQMTTTNGLDDGSEYAPDGKTIYFNSSRTGIMQLWRMDADGNNPKQITHDLFNNWFPHISPDGKTIIFLSYLPEVGADLHPYYQQVYLRTMPVAGGEPKIVAYLYGGQGTINVPSWSPDGKRVAFVSNSVTPNEKP